MVAYLKNILQYKIDPVPPTPLRTPWFIFTHLLLSDCKSFCLQMLCARQKGMGKKSIGSLQIWSSLHLGTRPVTSGPFFSAGAFTHKTTTLPECSPTELVAHYSIMCSLAPILKHASNCSQRSFMGLGGLHYYLHCIWTEYFCITNKSFNIIHQ